MQSNLIKTIGWIGTGVMGNSMCKHLIQKGYQLNVFNRTKSKTEELVSLGANFLQPQELASQSDAVFLMLGYPHDVQEMVLGQAGILTHLKPGTLLVDHTTSSPQLAAKIFDAAQKVGVNSIDAPVTGGDVGARDGTLVILCGGEKDDFQRAQPIFETYGKNVQLFGKPSFGQHAKMVNQVLLSSVMLGVVEGLLYGHQMGLPLEQLIDTLQGGAAGSPAWANLGLRMVKRNFDPGFYVEHFIKDMEIALQEAQRVNLCLPGLALVKQFYQSLVAHGCERNGTQALILVLEKMNNTELGKL